MALDITRTQITSPKSGNEYDLFVYEGRAIGCTCIHREKKKWVPCPHMTAYNEPKPVVEQVAVAPTFDSCICCGQRVKVGAVMCYRCSC